MRASDDVMTLKGIGKKTKEYLTRLGIETIEDLLRFYPTRYEAYVEPKMIGEYVEEEKACIQAEVIHPLSFLRAGRYQIIQTKISDGNQSIQVRWYHAPYLKSMIRQYASYVFVGKLVRKKSVLLLEHPIIYEVAYYREQIGMLKPVYALTKGISSGQISKYIKQAMETDMLDREVVFREYLPDFICKKYDLDSVKHAIHDIHMPSSKEELAYARKRLIFDDFFTFLYHTRLLKEERLHTTSAYVVHASDEIHRFRDTLPFRLTKAQNGVMEDIIQDMASGSVMNRLLQADVGSGKTIIALMALLAVVYAGYQGAMMAPTEVLANQHYQTIGKFLSHTQIRIALLTGSMTKKEKGSIYEQIKNHELDIVIGTHTLIQEGLVFDNLALVVTDEQHRFGVKQRMGLANKGKSPHILVMSATPIPRTLAVILYGDLDISTMEGKPAGRLPIKNVVIGKEDRNKAYKHIEEEIKKGHQAYVICPMVEESESIEAENVLDYSKNLNQFFKQKCKVEVLHGRMSQVQKDAIMKAFAEGSIDILVSTTVIEVGVDVANATVMMIEDAQRFGLASLHQLRGRVGRSDMQSYCIFVRTTESDNAKNRLDIVGRSNDGFFIAAEDLKLRGPGELFGVAQSGDLVFGIADIYSDTNILMQAKEAVDLLKNMELTATQRRVLDDRLQLYRQVHYHKLSL